MELDEQMLAGSKRGQQRLSDTEVGGAAYWGVCGMYDGQG